MYRFDAVSRQFSEVTQEAWNSASGAEVDCGANQLDGLSGFRVDGKQYGLYWGNDCKIETIGELAILARMSNSRDLVAILSAEGPPVTSVIPFWGGGGAKGQHYHQVMKVGTREFMGEAVQIALVSDGGLQSCWSPADRLVIYYKSSAVSFVSIDLSSER